MTLDDSCIPVISQSKIRERLKLPKLFFEIEYYPNQSNPNEEGLWTVIRICKNQFHWFKGAKFEDFKSVNRIFPFTYNYSSNNCCCIGWHINLYARNKEEALEKGKYYINRFLKYMNSSVVP